jgi:hypothetical protein
MKAFQVGYEYGPHMGDQFYVLAQDWGNAKELAVQFLKEEHLWDRVGNRNMNIAEVNYVPEKTLLIY